MARATSLKATQRRSWPLWSRLYVIVQLFATYAIVDQFIPNNLGIDLWSLPHLIQSVLDRNVHACVDLQEMNRPNIIYTGMLRPNIIPRISEVTSRDLYTDIWLQYQYVSVRIT